MFQCSRHINHTRVETTGLLEMAASLCLYYGPPRVLAMQRKLFPDTGVELFFILTVTQNYSLQYKKRVFLEPLRLTDLLLHELWQTKIHFFRWKNRVWPLAFHDLRALLFPVFLLQQLTKHIFANSGQHFINVTRRMPVHEKICQNKSFCLQCALRSFVSLATINDGSLFQNYSLIQLKPLSLSNELKPLWLCPLIHSYYGIARRQVTSGSH